MLEGLLNHRVVLQVTIFASLLLIFFILEMFFPRREFSYPKLIRRTSNLGLAFLNNVILHLIFPLMAVGVAHVVVLKGWGLFQWLAVPLGIQIIGGILLLDLIIYTQHIVFHRLPILWRLHRVHHADLELDVSSGIRFHPIEIIISMGIKMGAVLLLGVGPETVFIFEILLMATSLFNHSNLNFPVGFDKYLRFLLVTPDVHRVHHSILGDETNSNFGFNFPWWDRIFRTYRAQPRDGHQKMLIGIDLFRSPKWLYFHRLLIEPFVNN